MIKNLLIVGFGGAGGSMLRYAVQKVFNVHSAAAFPTGTLLVNIAGCFLIGVLWSVVSRSLSWNEEMKLLLMTGFCGGFTTFSTFGNETMNLFRDGENGFALLNVGLSVVVGLVLVWLGRSLAYLIWR